ncbi:RDD family protein [Luteimonas aquatica]|uniref:RDD family protein n=1 Tax=Luteimonas aquatica TaxID=450364 RepID=UPI001F55B84C|nr:RDD family protein [Luteimonas aquatica]
MEEVRPPFNPYSAPEAALARVEAGETTAPASRWRRLGAYLIDTALFFAAVLLPVIAVDGVGRLDSEQMSDAAVLAMLATLLALLVVDLILLQRQGQTLGKRWCAIRIVRSDGSRTGLGRLFGLRYLLAQGVLGIVPFFSLIDVLFIFGRERRCIHDMLADTIVVDA